MTKTKFLTAAALVLATIAAPALADPFDFTRDGVRYVGEKSQEGETVVLRGRNMSDNTAFTLRVAKGWVRGDVGNRLVDFQVPNAAAAKAGSID